MRKRPGISKTFTIIIATVCWLGFSLTAQAQNPRNVRMEVNQNQDALEIVTPANANGCPWYQSRGPGCVKAKKNESININMILQGNTKCEREYVDANTQWKMRAVYLGGFNADDKPASFGFTNTADADYQKVQSDFDVADRASGRINPLVQNDTLIRVKDDNQYKYVVWYKVEAACERNDGQPPYLIYSDPRVKNGGRG